MVVPLNPGSEEAIKRVNQAIAELQISRPIGSDSGMERTNKKVTEDYKFTLDQLRNELRNHLEAIQILAFNETRFGYGVAEMVIARTVMLGAATMVYLCEPEDDERALNYCRFARYRTAEEAKFFREMLNSPAIMKASETIGDAMEKAAESLESYDATLKDAGIGTMKGATEVVAKASRQTISQLRKHAAEKMKQAEAAKQLISLEVLFTTSFSVSSAFVHALDWPLSHQFTPELEPIAYRPDQVILSAAMMARHANAMYLRLLKSSA